MATTTILYQVGTTKIMSSYNDSIRILTADDHPLIRQGIAGLVATQSDMGVIAEAANGREAIEQFRTHRPDVTLMDLQMPETRGLDAITAIRGEFPEARITVITTYGCPSVARAESRSSRLSDKRRTG